MKAKSLLFLGITLLWGASLSAARVDSLDVWSPSMRKTVKTIVITPDGAKTKTHSTYPVLYLLHGYDGDQTSWLSIQPNLPQMVERDGIIVVCPDGQNSWYWDSPNDSTVCYETFVARELPSYIDSSYHTRADRSGRAITGLSMGGHGGMWISMRHKETFGGGGSTSGGLDMRPFPANWEMAQALGDSATYKARWDAHTAINQIDRIADNELAIIIDCGYDDFFLEVNNAFHRKLMERKIGHDYLVRPGGHNVPYWNNALDYQWLFFKKFFDRGR